MKRTYSEYFIICSVFSIAVFAFILFSDSLKNVALNQVALVSQFGASVTETPTNKLASELRDMSRNLDLREKTLDAREAALREEQERVSTQTRNVLLGTLFLALITLAFVNLYISKRSKKQHSIISNQYSSSSIHIPRHNLQIDLHNLQHR